MAHVKTLLDFLVYLVFLVLAGVIRCLPIETASRIGGWCGRQIGARDRRRTRALNHIKYVYGTKKTAAEREAILTQSWDTMGRIFVETMMLRRLLPEHDRFEMTGGTLGKQIKSDGIGAVFVGAHTGNWEVAMWPPACTGQNPAAIYRRVNNRFIDRYLYALRSQVCPGGLLLKDGMSAPKLIDLIKKGAHIGILCDQREHRGIVLPFLGQPAATMGLPALLAHRLKVPLIAGRIIRLPNVRFRFECVVIPIDTSAPLRTEVKSAMGKVNDLFSAWILEHPGQWLWAHRRWDHVDLARTREEERDKWHGDDKNTPPQNPLDKPDQSAPALSPPPPVVPLADHHVRTDNASVRTISTETKRDMNKV